MTVRKVLKLKDKPLIEAFFEIRWIPLPSRNNPFTRDPFFYIHVGKLLPLLVEQFPHTESPLPPNTPLPEEILQKMCHYRLFSAKKQMPLVQLCPGMLTLNVDASYSWRMFQKKLQFVVEQLYNSRPNLQEFSPEYLSLRYLNFFECNYDKNQVIDFLKNKLRLEILLPSELFETPLLSRDPSLFNSFWQFPCFDSTNSSIGSMFFSISAGEKDTKKGVSIEIGVHQQKQSHLFPINNTDVLIWANSAHDVIKHCFFTIIKKFKNELRL
jgi:uncharacterized protein (TIGR04255 family)